MRPACVLDRPNSGRIAMIAVLTFCRTMYEMKYIAQISASTLVVAGMPCGRAIAVSAIGFLLAARGGPPYACRAWLYAAPILFDQRAQEYGRMLRMDPGEVLELVAARGARRREDLRRLQRARRRQQPPLADLPRHLVVILRIPERSGHAAAARIEIDDL